MLDLIRKRRTFTALDYDDIIIIIPKEKFNIAGTHTHIYCTFVRVIKCKNIIDFNFIMMYVYEISNKKTLPSQIREANAPDEYQNIISGLKSLKWKYQIFVRIYSRV